MRVTRQGGYIKTIASWVWLLAQKLSIGIAIWGFQFPLRTFGNLFSIYPLITLSRVHIRVTNTYKLFWGGCRKKCWWFSNMAVIFSTDREGLHNCNTDETLWCHWLCVRHLECFPSQCAFYASCILGRLADGKKRSTVENLQKKHQVEDEEDGKEVKLTPKFSRLLLNFRL